MSREDMTTALKENLLDPDGGLHDAAIVEDYVPIDIEAITSRILDGARKATTKTSKDVSTRTKKKKKRDATEPSCTRFHALFASAQEMVGSHNKISKCQKV